MVPSSHAGVAGAVSKVGESALAHPYADCFSASRVASRKALPHF
jgi:hypothetical protein